MQRFLIFTTAVLWLLTSEVSAQQPTPTPTPIQRDPQAVAILAQALAAATTQNSVALPQDSVAQGTIKFINGVGATLKIESKGLKELRQDITYPDRQVSYVMNGGQGFSVRNGKRADLPLWVTQYHYPEHIPAISQMADFALPNMNLTYVGQETVSGSAAHHILLTLVPTDGTPANVAALISEFHVFVDVQTLLVTKTEDYVFSPDAIENRSLVEMYYSDYRSLNGLMVPYQISRYISGEKYCDMSFSGTDGTIPIFWARQQRQSEIGWNRRRSPNFTNFTCRWSESLAGHYRAA